MNNEGVKALKCKKCGYVWLPRTITPKQCPHCKSYDWNKGENKKNEKECLVCGYKWESKGGADPQQCPKCHSWMWKGTEDERFEIVSKCPECGVYSTNFYRCPFCGSLKEKGKNKIFVRIGSFYQAYKKEKKRRVVS